MNSLANKIKRYRSKECSRWRNIKTPGRCRAATLYANKANSFIKKQINKSVKDTKEGQVGLYNERRKSKTRDVYPIVNHDFDYKTAMIKNNNLYKLGFTNKPTTPNLYTYPIKLKKYLNIMLKDSYPKSTTVAGRDDVIDEDKLRVNIKNSYRYMDKTPPYPTFKKDYPECRFKTKGKHASSYFIRAGTCKTKIKNEEECIKNKFKWVENKPKFSKIFKQMLKTSKNKKPVEKLRGSCYKPRYLYIDNSSKGFYGQNGLQPSLINDIMNITPDKLFQILAGNNVDGGGLLPCPEGFIDYNSNRTKVSDHCSVKFIVIILLIFILYLLFYKQ